jgi:hypothetical protein
MMGNFPKLDNTDNKFEKISFQYLAFKMLIYTGIFIALEEPKK